MKHRSALAFTFSFLFCASASGADSVSEFKLPSGVLVRIVESPFDPSKHKITGCDLSSGSCLIDGHVPFGVVAGPPETYVRTIEVTAGGKKFSLDTSDMYNAWGSRPLEHPGAVRYFGGHCTDHGVCQLRGLFADGAASYVAEWSVVSGVSVRTVLTSSSDVVHLFMGNIDPPTYE